MTTLAGIPLWLAAACAAADDWSAKAEEEARHLIGKEYVSVLQGQRLIPYESSCTSVGGGTLSNSDLSSSGWAWGKARCQNRIVLMLERQVGWAGSLPRWKIIDTLLLPPVTVTDPNPHLLALESASSGTCVLNGRPEVEYFVAARYGDKDRIDWRTGIEQAWTFDLERGRIVPMSTEGIVCERADP